MNTVGAILAACWSWLLVSTSATAALFSAWWALGARSATLWWPWLVIGAAAAVVLWVFWWLWWRLPRFQAHRLDLIDDKERADVEDNFRKTIGSYLAARQC